MRKLFTLFLLTLLPLLASADNVVSGGLYYNVNPDDRTAEVVETYEIRYSGDIVATYSRYKFYKGNSTYSSDIFANIQIVFMHLLIAVA